MLQVDELKSQTGMVAYNLATRHCRGSLTGPGLLGDTVAGTGAGKTKPFILPQTGGNKKDCCYR